MEREEIQEEELIRTAWEKQKTEIINNIDKVMDKERGLDPEILEIMKEMLKTAKIKVSMRDYFETD
jgi:radical SAM superfamily enzyme